jgi:ribosomal protein L11 methylase PrmA
MNDNQNKYDQFIPDIDKVDIEISKCIKNILANNTSENVNEGIQLIRKRASLMMPGIFKKLKQEIK